MVVFHASTTLVIREPASTGSVRFLNSFLCTRFCLVSMPSGSTMKVDMESGPATASEEQ